MKRVLGIEYCGRHFFGWQRQSCGRTVQACVEDALSEVADHSVRVTCAGRTDTGVHAFKQVVHFETDRDRPSQAWVLGTNVNLPSDISVLWTKEVDDNFDARFSTLSRTYRYYILNRPSYSAISVGLITWEHRKLDIERMCVAALYLLGEHNFNSFRATQCQAKNPVRTIHSLYIVQREDVIAVTITANAFLQHMVRNIVGVLIAIGTNQKEPHWAKDVLAAEDRRFGGVTARSDGLYLYDVSYEERYSFPAPNPHIYF